MRFLAALATALRAIVMIHAIVWEGGKWIVRSLAGIRPDPVLPAAAAGIEYLDDDRAPEAGPRLPKFGGLPARHFQGVTLVTHARHLARGGDPVDVSCLPDEVLVWLEGLSRGQMNILAGSYPHEAEALIAGGTVPGLPPLKPDASTESVTRPEADASAEPAYAWPHRGERADVAMRDLLDHVERQHRRRTA
ncbi:hypothetical protein ASF36_22650 [Methylobacterium sp. Leaf90]|nr:hypothetical protein ASF36_22650 [Methylobacterium sp. Leaf90]